MRVTQNECHRGFNNLRHPDIRRVTRENGPPQTSCPQRSPKFIDLDFRLLYHSGYGRASHLFALWASSRVTIALRTGCGVNRRRAHIKGTIIDQNTTSNVDKSLSQFARWNQQCIISTSCKESHPESSSHTQISASCPIDSCVYEPLGSIWSQ